MRWGRLWLRRESSFLHHETLFFLSQSDQQMENKTTLQNGVGVKKFCCDDVTAISRARGEMSMRVTLEQSA
jgi:hypothetical protein